LQIFVAPTAPFHGDAVMPLVTEQGAIEAAGMRRKILFLQ
jgi:hypothetical protein